MCRCQECGKETETQLFEVNIPQFNVEEKFHLCNYCYNYWLMKFQYFARKLPSHKIYFSQNIFRRNI